MQIIQDGDMLTGNDILRIKNKPENLRYYLILSEGEQSKRLNNSLINKTVITELCLILFISLTQPSCYVGVKNKTKQLEVVMGSAETTKTKKYSANNSKL